MARTQVPDGGDGLHEWRLSESVIMKNVLCSDLSMGEHGLGPFVSGWKQVASSCERGNEPSCSIQRGEHPGYLRTH